jgi:hypothetical protein
MFDVQADTPYLWLGVATVSVAVFGLAVAVPGATAPDAAAVARAIDNVAVAPPGATDVVALGGDRSRLGGYRVTLETAGGRASAALVYGPVAVVGSDSPLAPLLAGDAPQTRFRSPRDFQATLAQAQTPGGAWRAAPDRIRIRRVEWGDVNATLVG